MLSWVQVLATPTADTGACVMLQFENRHYLFGQVAEGTQRLMVQRRIGMSRLEELFVTGPVGWRRLGGILGLILTSADVAESARQAVEQLELPRLKKNKLLAARVLSELRITAGPNLAHLLATARRFIFRKALPVLPREIGGDDARAADPASSSPDWEDRNIKVWYVPLHADKPRPQSRKRSHDVMAGSAGGAEAEAEAEASQEHEGAQQEGDRELLQSVVKNMFGSDWHLDALIETYINDVKPPAAMFVRDDNGHIKKYDGPLPGSGVNLSRVKVLVRTPWPGSKILHLPRTSPSRQSMCYIVHAHPIRGKFDAREALRLGVAKPDNRKLTEGLSVQGKDGLTVTPDMVMGAPRGGHGFAVVDIPDASYVEAFLERPEWSNDGISKAIKAVYWILGQGIIKDERIRQFMRDRPSIRHTVLSSDTCPNSYMMEGAAAAAVKMNRIDPDRFPILEYSNKPTFSPDAGATALFEPARGGSILRLAPELMFQDEKALPFMNPTSALSTMPAKVISLADAAKAKINSPEFIAEIEASEKDIPNRDAEIIALGTGSATPSKYRNVSATLLRVPGVGNYLFDCGENTMGQIRRLWGAEEADAILRDLKAIWISHLHADHHLGTASVIHAWHDATAATNPDAELAVASQANMLEWLREYADVEDYGYARLRPIRMRAPEVKDTSFGRRACEPIVFRPEEQAALGLARIDACYVEHCFGSLACVFTLTSGLKVAYSGDCRPSNEFVRIGQGATLLIHESTFEDELRGDARAKKHCTMAEALDVGRRMGARRVLLTHFSQRYPKVPVFENREEGAGGAEDQVYLMAFDHMRVKLGDFKKAAQFLPALRELHNEERQTAGNEDEILPPA